MIDLRDDLVTGYLMPPMLISNVLDMTYWPARTYLKIIDHMFTVQRECGNGPLQAMLSGDVINLRGCVRRNSGPSGGRENRHGYSSHLCLLVYELGVLSRHALSCLSIVFLHMKCVKNDCVRFPKQFLCNL